MAKLRFAEKLKLLLGMGAFGDDFYDDLADSLIEGDLGAGAAMKVADQLKSRSAKKRLADRDSVMAELKDILLEWAKGISLQPERGKLSFYLVLGVNGVGKTTSIAKMARLFAPSVDGGVILAAADTFRAAAIDQLRIHGERIGARVVHHQHGSDPGAVIYDAIEAAKASGSGLVMADTAGRLHNKEHLVRELEKIDKVIRARMDGGAYRKILVLDGTTGQNGIRQAEAFHAAIGLDAIVLSKYDSSSRGGLALAVAQQLGIPTAFLCTGEGYGDIRAFDPDSYLDDFLGMGK